MEEIDFQVIAGFLDGLKPIERITVSQWADKYRYLAPTASAEPGLWRTSRTPYLKEILDKLSVHDPVQEVVFMKGAQIGAALDVNTPIPTPDGWSTMGRLRVGDVVFDENGKRCNVIFVTEVMHEHKCYDVVFSDGSVIKADAEHRWAVWDDNDKRKERSPKVLLTEEISKTFKYRGVRNRYAVSVAKPIDCDAVELEIPPYSLGVWLGDGNSCSNRVTTHKDDAEEMLSYILEEGVSAEICVKHAKGNCVEIVFRKPNGLCQRGHNLGFYGQFKDGSCKKCRQERKVGKISKAKHKKFGESLLKLNLIRNKHIPAIYLRASIPQRFELLRGLMDTDGYVSPAGHCEFVSCEKQLSNDVFELIASLGMKPVMKLKKGGRKISIDGERYYTQGDIYRITFQAYKEDCVVNLKRKRAKLKAKADTRHTEVDRRRIVDVIPVESVPVKCISVDSSSHLYLAGKTMIPTHNTEAANCWIGYVIHIAPCPMLAVQPTDETVKRNSKVRIAPMIEATPVLKDRVGEARSRDANNTTFNKAFPGGVLVMTGANSAVGLRSMPVKSLLLDEVDGFVQDLDGEGSPIELAKARTRTFSNRKIFIISTPTVEGTSAIEKEFLSSDQRHYHVPCPHCGTMQALKWSNLKWEAGNPESARYYCDHCDEPIEERHKTSMLANGEWIAHAAENASTRKVGYHLSSLYSPFGWYAWADAARDWEDAQGDVNKLKVFINTVLGETWKDKGEAPPWELLYNRREQYRVNMVPLEVGMLTAGVDVQKDRLELEIVGWAKGKRTWSIDYRVLMGDTAGVEVWNQLAAVVSEMWEREDGAMMPLLMMAVDTGYNTSHVYEFCRRFDASKVVPVKGQERQAVMVAHPKLVDTTRSGKKVGKIQLWNIGVNLIKGELYGWLKQHKVDGEVEPPGYCHFPQYADTYFRGLTAEQVEYRKNNRGHGAYVWVKKYERNEPLDCRAYARAAAAIVGIDRLDDAAWENLKNSYDKGGKKQEAPVKRKKSDYWD